MRIFRILCLACFVFSTVLCSCVSNKKVVYLQESADSMIVQDSLIKNDYPDYNLQVGDILKVNVKSSDPNVVAIFQQEIVTAGSAQLAQNAADINYLTGYTIDLNGEVELPLVGSIYVDNLSLSECKELITKEIKKYVTDAFVQVRLGGIRYSALGEFNKPGRYSILQSRATIFEAIANAGDLTVLANRKKAILVRQYSDGSKLHEIDLTDRSLLLSPFYYIQPNDQIYLEPLSVRQFGNGVGVTGFQTFGTLLSALSSTLLIIVTLNSL